MKAHQEEPTRFEVELTAEALDDIRSIRDHIEKELNTPKAAIRTVEGILSTAAALSTMPYRNRSLSPDATDHEVRSAKAGNYRLLYLVIGMRVVIFAVLYSRRDIEGRLSELLGRMQ